MPRSRYRILSKASPHFLTATINYWQPLFTRTEIVDIILDSWRFLQREAEFEIYGVTTQVNRLAQQQRLGFYFYSHTKARRHKALTCFVSKASLGHVVVKNRRNNVQLTLFKRAHKTESQYQIWEEGSHPQLIESETVMRQKLDYIHQNPVKRGYVDLPGHWRYSSARNYLGLEGLIEVVRAW